jgi:hypothetical protein
VNPGNNLDDNVEHLLMTLMTTSMTPMTTGEDLLMTRDDNTVDYCDDNVL